MKIQVTNESPLQVSVDGILATVLTHSYNDGNGDPQTCKYIVADGQNYVIVALSNFDASTLPTP